MFRKISSGETTDLDALFEKLQFHSPAAFLLCLDQKFSIPTSIENLPMKRLSTHLSHFSTYVHLLRDILTSNSCCQAVETFVVLFDTRDYAVAYLAHGVDC